MTVEQATTPAEGAVPSEHSAAAVSATEPTVHWGVRVGKAWEGIGVIPSSEEEARKEARRAPTLHLVRSTDGGPWEDTP